MSEWTPMPEWLPGWVETQSDEAHELAREVWKVLHPRTRRRHPDMTYQDVGDRVGKGAHDPVLWNALGIVSYWSLRRYGYALSALVHRYDTGLPGNAFWGLVTDAKKLDDETKWQLVEEQKKLMRRKGA